MIVKTTAPQGSADCINAGTGNGGNSQAELPDWKSVGGLQDVVKQLKEMVTLPLLYPEFFRHMGVTPPR